MRRSFPILMLLGFLLPKMSLAQWKVLSPNGTIQASVQLSNDGKLTYSVSFTENSASTTLINASPLGITRSDQDFTSNLSVESTTTAMIDDHYTMVTGKQSALWNHANELTLNCKNNNNAHLQVIFRAYDDGVAFRYRFSDTSSQNVNIIAENTGFAMNLGGKAWLSKNLVDYQEYYVQTPIGNAAPNGYGWNFPALFQNNNFWYLLAESDVNENNYASHLDPTAQNGLYKIQLPSQADGNNYNYFATTTLPVTLPWRTIILGKNLSTIVESSLINHLAAPSTIANTSWIKPGIASWSWWSDFSSPTDYNKLKQFVDFSKAQGFPYTLVDEGWNTMTGGNLTQLVQYAQTQSVGIWVWYNSGGPSNNLPDSPRDLMYDPNIRQAEMLKLKNMGVKGIKVDFFLSDKQQLMQLYHAILKDAANYQLMVNFHGCTVPKGWQRTYPNLMSMEAVSGDEQLLFNPGDFRSNSPAHNVNLVFTRNVVGSMDYTPGIISIDRVPHNTTTAHELSLLALFESGVSHLADNWTNYQNLGAAPLKLISSLPSAWDETRFLQGEPGKYAILARRKGSNWYIAGINGTNTTLSLQFGLPFVTSGNFTKQLLADGSDGRSVNMSNSTYTLGETQTLSLIPYGGFILVLNTIPCNTSKPVINQATISQTITLSINTTATASIQWLLNGGAIAGANSAKFIPTQSGSYSVSVTDNGCTNLSDAVQVTIAKMSLTINGKNPACDGDSVSLTAATGFDKYVWFTNNDSLLSTSNTFLVSKSGLYKVVGIIGTSTRQSSDTVRITFNPNPSKPQIFLTQNTLVSSSSSGNQWYANGMLLSGEIKPQLSSYTASKSYVVKVTLNGCTASSDPFIITAVSPLLDEKVNIFPNPSDGLFQISYPQARNIKISVHDVSGKLFLETYPKDGTNSLNLDLSNLPHSNIYYLKITSEQWSDVKKVYLK